MITQKVYITDIEGRIDPFSYKPSFIKKYQEINNSKYKKAALGNLITDLKNGVEIRQYVSNGFRYLRVTDLDDFGINENDPRFVGVTEIPSKIKLTKSDFLISRSGSLGLVTSVKEEILNSILSSHIFKLSLDTSKILPEYLELFLRSELGQFQFFQKNNGGIVPEINQSALKSITIIVPPIKIQKELIEIAKSFYQQREEKLKQADELLNSIDDFIRQQLGIDYKEPEEEKIYTVNSQNIEENRHDPYYYNPKFVNLLNAVGSNLKMLALSDVSENVFNGNTPAKDKYTNEGKPIVKVSCLKKNKVDWSNLAYAKDKRLNKYLRNNDILLLSSAHQAEYLGKNPCIVEIPDKLQEQDITFVGELICIRPNTDLIDPYYLLAILQLKEYHLLINREKRGQTSHIYPDDLKRIKIPFVEKPKQETIAQEFRERLHKAEELKNEASELLKQAKKQVEAMILN